MTDYGDLPTSWSAEQRQEFVDSLPPIAIPDKPIPPAKATETQKPRDIALLSSKHLADVAWNALWEKDRNIGSGFAALDNLIGGFRPGSLNIVAARPGGGKTALALQMLGNMIFRQKKKALYFSLEMTALEIVYRIVAARTGIPSFLLRRGGGLALRGDYKEQVRTALDEFKTTDCTIDDNTFDLPVILQTIRDCSPDIVFIDFLTLIARPADITDYRQHVAQCCRALKGIAKEMQVPVVALSQLNRDTNRTSPKTADDLIKQCRTTLMNLSEADSVGQMADVVIALNRPAAVFPQTAKDLNLDDFCEIEVIKNRHGRTGFFETTFEGSTMTFNEHKEEKSDDGCI
jgi:replicative DNA helicase